ncbi:mechanosensitive ion channel family protein [Halioglobus maricola]|uniref:Small-conductance mechanosensitive channel n=1 Tax=Halioglobus maricola TaxID=2601894 RepID=A0A5P9NM06_9GAMM|nr:mechanosensitive ion channel domain-containing protein [Halioglobus maricola]QFU76893.1 mechanosensitive ion channel family protein [Halioglobus maricola]
MSDPNQVPVDPNQATEPEVATIIDNPLITPAPISEDTLFILHLFGEMDAQAPLMRLIIAGVIVGVSLMLLLASRIYFHRRIARMEELPEARYKALRWQAQDLLSAEDMKSFWIGLNRWVGRLITLAFALVALNGLLLTSGWTLRLAARMINGFLQALLYIWQGFISYLPNLLTIILIVVAARFVIRMLSLIFDGIRTRRIYLKNFYPEWADTSFGIIKLLVYALTAVIIFPYLPGSSSPAFQGISIFVGVLVSLGSTTAVANIIAGVVLTYTRAFQIGDQVDVAETRGRVVERSMFVTRIQTLKNVIVSIPNSMVLNNNIINYSKNMGQTGLLVHTGITIGYDVPWQVVNKLLVGAASKTEGIAETPPPFVLQTSLEDNYVAYEVNGWTRKPEELPRIYSMLHANILDEFHGHNVEITSPHYRAVRDGNPVNVPEVLSEEEPEDEPEENSQEVSDKS